MQQQRFLFRCAGVIMLAIGLFDANPVNAAAALQKVVFVFSGFNERTSFIFVAKDRHFFEEQGLDLQIVQVRNGPVAVAAMAANEAQFYTTSATGSTLGSMASGLDLVFVAGIINRLDGDFVAAPKILTPNDLKGKSLGVQSIGGGIWTFSMLALDHWGLNPERDKIQFRILGDQSVIAQGLISGAADAAFLGYTFSKLVQRQGFRVLQDFANVELSYQGIGIVARKAFLDQSPDIAERTLKALSRTIAYYQDPANKQTVVAILAKWLRLQKIEDAAAGYDAVRNLYNRRIFPTVDGVRNALRILDRVDPKFGRIKAESLVDERIVRKLERDGVFK